MDIAYRMWVRTVTKPNGCLEWQGAVNQHGYGTVTYEKDGKRTSTSAHRRYYELMVGPVPDDMNVCHKCDNRLCINPDHMFIGDQTANIRDMMQKGRDNFRGRRSPQPHQQHHRPHAEQIPPDEQQNAL